MNEGQEITQIHDSQQPTSSLSRFNGDLGAYDIIETADGTPTIYSNYFGEACHSSHGAFEETLVHYIEGCRVRESLFKYGEIKVLEIGFGAGYGADVTALQIAPYQRVKFLSTELDPQLVKYARDHACDGHLMASLKESEYFGIPCFEANNLEMHLIVLIGDARETLKQLAEKGPQKVHAIYQDAFSPKRNPQLWTVEWFELLKVYADQKTFLGTYSASVNIRKSMREAGWSIHKGPGFGPKRSSTRADLLGGSNKELLELLERSPIEALRNKDLEN